MTIASWRSGQLQRSEVRSYVYAVVQALDWLAKTVSDMNIKKVGAERVIAFHRGFNEPGFLASDVPDFKPCHLIKEQEKFIYCHHTMEGKHFAKNNAAVHKFMYKMYKCVSDSNPQISDDLKEMIDGGLKYHKPKN